MSGSPIRRPVFEALAALLDYPGPGFRDTADATESLAASESPDLGGALAPFLAHVRSATREDLEEAYTRTFDFNPARALELGWHLFGEQYERGAFLVSTRDRLRRAGLSEGRELPDHLTTMLRLLARLPDDEAATLSREVLVPALERISAGFEGEANPYAALIGAVADAVRRTGAPSPAGGSA